MQRSLRRIKNAKGKYVWHARLRYIDSNGKPRELLRRATGKGDANAQLDRLATEIREKGSVHLEAGKVTFRKLGEYCKDNVYTEATYDEDGSKISGVRSVKTAHSEIDRLLGHFGDRDIRKITFEDLQEYRKGRLAGTIGVRKVKKATVHRDLQKLKAMLYIALRKKWIITLPFWEDAKKELIQSATEPKRTRVLSPEEELKLFKALDKPGRRHTIPIFIASIDTGARRSSLVEHLKWKHVDFDAGTVIVTTFKDKNIKRWAVPMTARLRAELRKLKLQSGNDPEALVFRDAAVNLRKIFDAVRDELGLHDFQFRDQRHTTGTRLGVNGAELQEVARILGHTKTEMTYRYFDLTKETRDKVRGILDRCNEAVQAQAEK